MECSKAEESLKKSEIKLEKKNLGCQTKTLKVIFTNRLHDIDRESQVVKTRQKK